MSGFAGLLHLGWSSLLALYVNDLAQEFTQANLDDMTFSISLHADDTVLVTENMFEYYEFMGQ